MQIHQVHESTAADTWTSKHGDGLRMTYTTLTFFTVLRVLRDP